VRGKEAVHVFQVRRKEPVRGRERQEEEEEEAREEEEEEEARKASFK
jgi:hypothetical protein